MWPGRLIVPPAALIKRARMGICIGGKELCYIVTAHDSLAGANRKLWTDGARKVFPARDVRMWRIGALEMMEHEKE